MGIFENWFGQEKIVKKEEKKVPWINLTSMEQLERITKDSATRTQVIFKHSTTCGISRMVLKMFTESYTFSESQVDLYYLDLHSYRAISNAVAVQFRLQHQSPQLIILKNGSVVAHASHGAITDIALERYL